MVEGAVFAQELDIRIRGHRVWLKLAEYLGYPSLVVPALYRRPQCYTGPQYWVTDGHVNRLGTTPAQPKQTKKYRPTVPITDTLLPWLGRAPSTVSREITRHGGRSSYRATDADKVAWESALRPKPGLLALNGKLRNIVASKLSLDWSPERVAGWLKLQYPDDERMRVSHETIYRSLFIQTRGVLKKELIRHLRTRRTLRHPRRAGAQDELRGQIPDAVSIRDRPTDVEERAIPGHFSGQISGAPPAT